MTDPLLQLVMHLAPGPRLSVLSYHRVLAQFDPLRPSEPTVAQFETRMRWIASNFVVMPLLEAVAALKGKGLPRRALCLTFDDGYANNFELVLPIVRRLRLPATFFIATGYLDGGCMFNDAVIEAVREARGAILDLEAFGFGRHRLDTIAARRLAIGRILGRLRYFAPERREEATLNILERVGATVPKSLMMSTQQVAALHAAGMEIGAHTVSHPILAEIPFEHARDEITRSRAHLERITGAPVRIFAYPNGKPSLDYRPEHVELVRELGFDAAVSTAGGTSRAGDDVFQIPRFTPWDRANWRFGLRIARNILSRPYALA
jgi:peptidoglycan/xylan/chitin deacetylase (PgdA/CDA1 family)